jgi:hypothetical protein
LTAGHGGLALDFAAATSHLAPDLITGAGQALPGRPVGS